MVCMCEVTDATDSVLCPALQVFCLPRLVGDQSPFALYLLKLMLVPQSCPAVAMATVSGPRPAHGVLPSLSGLWGGFKDQPH